MSSLGPEKLPARARPVRKGDKLCNSLGEPRIFLGSLGEYRYVVIADNPDKVLADFPDKNEWTHADGTPIDWQASE